MHQFEEEAAATPSSWLGRFEVLRPMTSGEVIDLTTKAYREIGLKVLRPTFGAALMVYIAYVMMSQLVAPQLFLTTAPENISKQILEFVTTLGLGLFVAVPIGLIGLSMIMVHTVHAVSDFFAQRVIHPMERQSRADRDLPRMLKLSGTSFLVASSGSLLAVVALVLAAMFQQQAMGDASAFAGFIGVIASLSAIFSVAYVVIGQSLLPAVHLLEGKSYREAAKRTRELLKGYRGSWAGYDTVVSFAFLTFILILAMVSMIAFVMGTLRVEDFLTAVVGQFWWGEVLVSLAAGVPYFIAVWLLLPVWTIGTTVIYFERRIRLEGYDIELLNHELASKNRR